MTVKGGHLSEEHKRHISEAHERCPMSEESRRKISETRKGRPMSEESRRKISEARKGRPMSEETKRKISEARKGRPMSEESRRKISEVRKGRPMSEESRRKISEARKGRPMSEESRRKISEARTGGHISKEHKRCISEALSGPKSPQWKGGISFAPYCPKFNNDFKERVRAFFGRRCVECGAVESKVKLAVHHVNFRKDSCCNKEVEPLFVPLCSSCHARTSHNRRYWEARYTTMINEQYGSMCYLPKLV